MSAIWGAISLKGEKIPAETAERMKSAFDIYKIDRTESIISENVVMGCGIQYFTKESQYEQLPVAEQEVFFTADVVLDNREELLENLEISRESVIPDGEILYHTYKKYGNQCLNDMRGSYTFVYYDKNENAIYVVADTVGTRCLYYCYEDGVFRFATVMKALGQSEEKRKMNERWLLDFLALDNLVGLTECTETMYEGIYKLEPAQMLKITAKGIEKQRYWNPQPKELRLKSDEEYKHRFIEVFGKSVKCLLRAEKKAMLLSGGLDSSSIACFAAPELKKNGEVLHAFTSVPESDYVSDKNAYYVTNESEKARRTAEFLGNVKNHWIELEGKEPWAAHEEIKKGLEIPYKSPQNIQWMIKGLQEAARLGARIVLEGGYGNVTISFGNPQVYFNTLLMQKRYFSYCKEMNCFGEKYGWGKKQKIKMLIKTAKTYYIKNRDEKSVLGKAFVKKEKIEKCKLEEHMSKIYETRTEEKMDVEINRKLMFDDLQLSHKGEINTKQSLMTGVLFRDPCMDKRLIEFCMSLPIEQFCSHGIARRLVREYLKGIVPEHIIKVESYGCQSADMLWKVKKNWNMIYEDMNEIFRRNMQQDIVDCEAAIEELEKMNKDVMGTEAFDFMRLFYTAMLLETMEENEM